MLHKGIFSDRLKVGKKGVTPVLGCQMCKSFLTKCLIFQNNLSRKKKVSQGFVIKSFFLLSLSLSLSKPDFDDNWKSFEMSFITLEMTQMEKKWKNVIKNLAQDREKVSATKIPVGKKVLWFWSVSSDSVSQPSEISKPCFGGSVQDASVLLGQVF